MFSFVCWLNGCGGLHCGAEWGQECSLGESLNEAFWRQGTESRGLPETSGAGETACSSPLFTSVLSSPHISFPLVSSAALLLSRCLHLSTVWRLPLKGSGNVCWRDSLCPSLENELQGEKSESDQRRTAEKARTTSSDRIEREPMSLSLCEVSPIIFPFPISTDDFFLKG